MRRRIIVSPAEKRKLTIDRCPPIKSREICVSSSSGKKTHGLIVFEKVLKPSGYCLAGVERALSRILV